MHRRVLCVMAVMLGVLAAHGWGALRPLNNALAEWRFGWITRAPTGAVVLVDIDAESLAALGTWPWPRTVHGELIDKLVGLGASEIALDIDFSSASTPAGDQALEDALKRAGGSVVLAAFNQSRAADAPAGDIQANAPLARFAANAWSATVNVRLDADGAARRFGFGESVAGGYLPSVPAMLGGHSGGDAGEFLIDFGIAAGAVDRVSAIDLLNGTVARDRIAGRKVILGASAVELRDLFRTPVYGTVSGPMVQALATESILQGRMLRETGFWVTLAGLLAIAAGALATWRARWTIVLGGIAAASVACELAALGIQEWRPLILDTSAWQVALAALALCVLVREIGLRRILLLISGTETQNTKTILSQVVWDSFAGVVVADEGGIVHSASRSAARMLGFDETADLNWRRSDQILPAALSDALAASIKACRAGIWTETPAQDFARKGPDGEERMLEYVVRPSRLSGGLNTDGSAHPDQFVASLTFADVTESRRLEARLAYLARFDPLTGLANRNQFCERLDEALETWASSGAICAVLCFNLDRFQTINETLGYSPGDHLLRAVAERTRDLIGPASLLSRIGGHQFAVLAVGDDAVADGSAFARELIRSGGEPYDIEGHRLLIGISVGIALPQAGMDGLALLKRADAALHRAKASGGNVVLAYNTQMDAGLQARQQLEVDLWDAFERDQFEIHYQPQVAFGDGEITGVEALLRWRHPIRGYVSPAEFIPVAEAVGLVDPLGAWVLRSACKTVAAWPRPVRLAVNVSPVQFTRGNLVENVRAALRDSGLPPSRLDLEITESLFIGGSAGISAAIAEVRAMGVSFAIDDFGTGYSSLGYLTKFPVRKLKIDKSFADGVPSRPESVAIVRAVVTLAHSLGIKVNVEGVETPGQAAALRSLGCDEGQGWLYGKAVSGAEFAARLAASPDERRSA